MGVREGSSRNEKEAGAAGGDHTDKVPGTTRDWADWHVAWLDDVGGADDVLDTFRHRLRHGPNHVVAAAFVRQCVVEEGLWLSGNRPAEMRGQGLLLAAI